MDNVKFYNSFSFSRISLSRNKHTDNSCGICAHFVGRLIRGKARIVAEGGEVMELLPGDIFYLPVGLRYHSYWYTDSDGVVEWDSYRFDFFSCKSGRQYVMQKLYPNDKALSYFNAIDYNGGVSNLSIGMLFAFLGECFADMETNEGNRERQLFSKATDYILRYPSFKVCELARHLGMSESGVYLFFRTYGGTSPIELKNKLLAQKAVTLLSSTDLSVEQIATKLGFKSSAYLRRVLKTHLGESPSSVRKNRVMN